MGGPHHHSEFPLEELRARKAERISVVLPAREVAETIGPIVDSLLSLDGLIDQLVVVDAASRDGTAEIALARGAEVCQEAELVPEFGPVLGKGDAMWRALSVASGDIVLYLDSDTGDFSPHFATGMLGPLLTRPEVQFVKGAFRRPFVSGGLTLPDGGGRVTELTARPLLCAFYPELAGFSQPLAREVAARRTLLERVPFATCYAVETAMLLDVYALEGLTAMAQVDLGERRNAHQPLRALGPMAYAVLSAVIERLRRDGRLADGERLPFQAPDGNLIDVLMVERPPFASLRTPA